MIRLILTTLLLLLSFAQTAQAAELDYTAFEQIPVLHEGRVKPLDSFARIYLRRFSGHDRIGDTSASAWLARTIFDPASAAEQPVFFVQDKTLRAQLGLSPEQQRFSLSELQQALAPTTEQISALLAKEPETLTPAQQELLRLHSAVLDYADLMRSVSLLLPLNVELPQRYKADIDPNAQDFVTLAPLEDRLRADLQTVIKRKGNDIERYSAEEQKLATLSYQLTLLKGAGENTTLLKLFPGKTGQDWLTPWAAYTHTDLTQWRDLALAWRNNDAALWHQIGAVVLHNALEQHVSAVHAQKLWLEILYNRLAPYRLAMAFYALSLLILLGAKFMRRADMLAQISFALGVLTHALALGARMYMLARPPVGTLYESVLFVSLIAALLSLFIALEQNSRAALFAGGVTALLLLLLAPALVPQGESMEMLVAVLNTNFWLATHVLCITAGYGVCILCAGLSHVYLAFQAAGKHQNLAQKLQQNIYRISLFALLLMAVGTILGGIWADQSWGRFWGWDPKENGALLIVLWLIWLQHGRISAKLSPLHFILGNAWLNVIVALSWFGVNLLNVGLHSYGFISGMAWGLGLFCGFETLLLSGLWLRARHREKETA